MKTNPTIRAELRQRLIDKGVKPKRADALLKLADQTTGDGKRTRREAP